MKKFLKKVGLLLLLTAILFVGINWPLYEWVVIPNRMIAKGTDKFQSVPDGIQVANLGNSHGARAFDYAQLREITGFNFGLSAQPLPDDWAVLNYYQDHLDQDAVLFISVSFFSLYQDERAQSDHQDRSRVYDDFLPAGYQTNPAPDSRWFQAFPLVRFNPDEIVKYLDSSKAYLESGWNQRLDSESPEQIRQDALKSYQSHAPESTKINDRALEALDRIVNLCRQKGWTPIFCTAPYPDVYVEQYPPEFLKRFDSDMEALSRRYDAPYLDYSRHPDFSGDYSLFMDADHVNKAGAEKFTRMILREARGLYPDSPLGAEPGLKE